MHHNGVKVHGLACWDALLLIALLVPSDEVKEPILSTLKRDKTQSVCENFVLNDGSVVVHEDGFNCDSWNFSDENATESVGNRGVDADEGEGGIELAIVVELDLQVLLELFEIPGVVFAGVMAREVGGGNIVDSL